MNPPITFQRHGAVATITLSAPQTHNALTPEMLCRLCDAVKEFAGDPGLRVAIITGSGDRAFCAGGDLARTIPLLSGDRAPDDEWDHRLLSDPEILAASGLREYPLHKPVIAAINGACMAAGFELMLGTDLRIAAEHAVFALPEVKRGVIPFAGSMVRLPRQLPYCHAMEILLTGDALTADDAYRMGLVNRVVPASQVMPEALSLAERIAKNGPLAVQAVKRTVVESSGLPLSDGYRLENESKRTVLSSEDAREGPRAFLEKREPHYHGR